MAFRLLDARRLRAIAPVLYLVTALPTVMLLSFLTPPFQVADEGNHFRRVVHILGGGIVGKRVSQDMSGGPIPKPAVDIDVPTVPLINHPERKVDPAMVVALRAVRWSDVRQFQAFPNTVLYPPSFYMPSLAAVAVGRAIGLGLVDSATLARLANGLAVVLLGTAALAIARRGRPVLFVVLSTPMLLFSAAGITQDGLMLACAALAVALVCRATADGARLSRAQQIGAGALMGLIVASRPPYAPLLAILLMRPLRGSGALGLMPLVVALAIPAGWIVLGAVPVVTTFRAADGVSTQGQLAYLIDHPGAVPRVAAATLWNRGAWHYRGFVGILGWEDTQLPSTAYWAAALALATAVALACSAPGAALVPQEAAAISAAVIVSIAAVYGALYLTWTPVGSPEIEGVQGRYFLPIAAFASLGLPALVRGRQSPSVAHASAAGWILLFGLALGNAIMLPYVVFTRYHG